MNARLATTAGRTGAPDAFAVPAPDGPYAVGTLDWLVVDSARRDTLETSGGRYVGPRRLMVTVWYPTASKSRGDDRRGTAPYLRHGPDEVAVLATLQRRPDSLFAPLVAARGHGRLGAPAWRPTARGRLPVVLLSHGYVSSPSVHTELAEALASRGWVVLAVAHTGEAQAVRFPDGTRVTMLAPPSPDGTVAPGLVGLAARPRAVIAEWGPEDSVVTAATAAPDDASRRAILARYLAAVPASAAGVARWVGDLRVVLDAAARPAGAAGALGAGLAGRLAVARVGAVGHSFGGVAAGAFCRVDARCAAALNLDGLPPYGILDRVAPGTRAGDGAPARRPLLMLYTERAGRVGGSDALYAATAAPYRVAVLRGARHLDPSDWTRYGPGLRRGPGFGAIAPDDAARATIALVSAWLDRQVRGRAAPLLDGRAQQPALDVRAP